jgi:hypothetical protein
VTDFLLRPVFSSLYFVHPGVVGVRDMESQRRTIAKADEALLTELGYEQEFKRAFTPLEVHTLPQLKLFARLNGKATAGLRHSFQYHWPAPLDRASHLLCFHSRGTRLTSSTYIAQCCFMPFLMEDQWQWCGVYVIDDYMRELC